MKHGILFLLLIIVGTACHQQGCDQQVKIDPVSYQAYQQDPFVLKSAQIIEHCLRVEVHYAGGCSSTSPQFQLIDAGHVNDINPAQRLVKLTFNDADNCPVMVRRHLCFDLRPLQIDQSESIVLELENNGRRLAYCY